MPLILRFLAAQVAAFALLMGLTRIQALAEAISIWGWVGIDSALAAILVACFRLPWWWWPLAAAIPWAVVGASGSELPWWAWAGGLAVLGVIYGGGVATRVPLYLSNQAAAEELARLLPPGARMVDLGAGLGGPVLRVARLRSDIHACGVEASPLPWLVCWLRALGRGRIRMRLGNLFAHDLAAYDAVYAFLSPEPMPRLWEKARRELRPGSLFISNTFIVPGVEPERRIPLPGRSDAALYVYRLSGSP